MSLNQEKYQTLANLLGQLHSDTINNQVNITHLREHLSCLQQFFRQQIAPLPEVDSREQSYRTEISKQLRLLEIDVTFLQGARQQFTSETRRRTIGDRIATLLQYCDAILQA